MSIPTADSLRAAIERVRDWMENEPGSKPPFEYINTLCDAAAHAQADAEELAVARPLLNKALRTITEWDGPFEHPFLKLAQPVLELRATRARAARKESP